MLQKSPKQAKANSFAVGVDRDELVEALNLVCKCLDRSSTIPIVGHVLFHPYSAARGQTWFDVRLLRAGKKLPQKPKINSSIFAGRSKRACKQARRTVRRCLMRSNT